MNQSTVKLNAELLKKVDKVTLKNTQGEIGAFDLFFELLANLTTLEIQNPIHLFEPLLDPSKDMQEIQKMMTLYTDFHNSIIVAFNGFSEGKSQHYLKKNLFNLIEINIPESLENDYLLKRILVSLMRPIMLFLKTHDIVIANTKELQAAMREKFDLNEEFIEDISDALLLNTIAQKKKLYANGLDFTPKEFTHMMINKILELSVLFLDIRKKQMPETNKNTIQTDMVELGGLATYNGINYEGVEKNDPCPCGSGKKYKKCCRKAWEYPLSTLSPQKILSKPKLSMDEVKDYYQLFNKLMVFVQNDYAIKNNKKCLNNVFEIQYDETYAANYGLIESKEIIKIIQHLGNHRELVSLFIDKHKSELTDEELEIYKDWTHFLHIRCMIMQTHNNSQIFVWDTKAHKIYLVYGLYDSLASVVPHYPLLANMNLFPFKGRIVFDGLLLGEPVDYGNNILRMMVGEYTEDIQTNGIILEIASED